MTGSVEFECIEFEIEHAGRRLSLAQLQHGEGIIDIGQDRHSAQTWSIWPPGACALERLLSTPYNSTTLYLVRTNY